MFAKIFGQIFDSSIAECHTTRHVFMDLLVLADAEGAVDMTAQAISRRTNVPLATVNKALAELQAPDAESRSKGEDGRRLVPLDAGRSWGWRIVNYLHYRKVMDEEARRSYFRDYRRKERAEKGDGVQRVQLGSTKFTQEEEEGNVRMPAPGSQNPGGLLNSGKVRPTLDEARASANQIGVTEAQAEAWWNAREAADWLKGTAGGGALPVGSNWRADMKSWNNTKTENDNTRSHAKHQRPNRTDGLNKAGRYS